MSITAIFSLASVQLQKTTHAVPTSFQLLLFNFYDSSFKMSSSKLFYFRYRQFRDLKKKTLLASTTCLPSATCIFSIPDSFCAFRNRLLVGDASTDNRSCKVQQSSVPYSAHSAQCWATHQDKLDRTELALIKLLTLNFMLEN